MTRLILTILLAAALSLQSRPSSAAGADVYIRGIEIYGNVTTRPEILRHFITFDTGQVLDTASLRATRAALLATGLYDKVDVFSHMREDGAHVFIILRESLRLQLGYGGSYSTRRYGQQDLWLSLSVDAGFSNFRGRMEELWVGVGVWDRWALDVSWYKPFLSTPYYILIGAGTATYPDFILPLDYVDVYATATAGRKFGEYSSVSLSAIPVYRHRGIVGRVNRLPAADGDGTLLDGGTRIDPDGFRNEIYEAFAQLSYSVDRRNARFDPQSGWYAATALRTNRLYSGENVPFFQLANEFRYYVPLGPGDMASARLRLTLRDRDAGAYHRLVYGGAGEVRGYSDNALGWDFVANSSLLASVKYHKRVFQSPRVPMPLIDLIFTGVKEVSFRFDATFIADYARLSRGHLGILTLSEPWRSGLGIGFGTRIVVPELRQSGCVELVFGRIDNADGVRWEPALHLYLDLFY
jgi:outer membrane protein assembly factor BamA